MLAFIGVTLESGGNYGSVSLMPYLAANVSGVVTTMMNLAPNAAPVAAIVFELTMMANRTLGFLFFGIATLYANVLPRWAGLLLILGVLLAFGRGVSLLIGGVAAAIFGLGLAWLGLCTLVRTRYNRSKKSMKNPAYHRESGGFANSPLLKIRGDMGRAKQST